MYCVDIQWAYYYNFSVLLQTCPKCKQIIELRSLAILAPKFGDSVLWHPDCFVCTECNQLLVDLTYCVHDDKLYCERHYAEQLKPRCAACDEVGTDFAINLFVLLLKGFTMIKPLGIINWGGGGSIYKTIH